MYIRGSRTAFTPFFRLDRVLRVPCGEPYAHTCRLLFWGRHTVCCPGALLRFDAAVYAAAGEAV